MKKKNYKKILLGTGGLNWERSERVTDRYGYIFLSKEGAGDYHLDFSGFKWLDGTYGVLFCLITETQQSTHIGDFFRGISPTTPKVGDQIAIGDGYLSFPDDKCLIGLTPLIQRNNDWLNPHALYRCHQQTVELYFKEMEIPETK